MKPFSDENSYFQYGDKQVPVIFLSELLNEEHHRYEQSYRILVAGNENNLIGIVVDSAEEIIRVTDAKLQPSVLNAQIEFIESSLTEDERQVHIVSVPTLQLA